MENGIIICGLNGCGKTTIGRKLAKRLNYRSMDVEDYFFLDTEIPYTLSRTRDEVEYLLLEDIRVYKNYVLSSVKCNYCPEIISTIKLVVFLYAPVELRLKRIEQREMIRFGKRALSGGDMYESLQKFHETVAKRTEDEVMKYIDHLSCPVLKINTTLAVDEIVDHIYEYYMRNVGEYS